MIIAGLISGFVLFLSGIFLIIYSVVIYSGIPKSFLGVVFMVFPFFIGLMFLVVGWLMIFDSIAEMRDVEQ